VKELDPKGKLFLTGLTGFSGFFSRRAAENAEKFKS
jgi:hypothetical protein